MTEKIRWCVIAVATNEVICYEESLYEALLTVTSVPNVKVGIEVEQRVVRDPLPEEMING